MLIFYKDVVVLLGSDKKFIIIFDYNKNKGGVDNLDKLIVIYIC